MLCCTKSCFGKKQEAWFVPDKNPSVWSAAVYNQDTEGPLVKANVQAHLKEEGRYCVAEQFAITVLPRLD